MYRTSVDYVGGTADLPDYVYYNSSIINNQTDSTAKGIAFEDPLIRFNETRDAALIKDASQYYFSIVRFTINGANLDLPLFIPQVQESTGQTNVDLTVYGAAIPFTQTWNITTGAGVVPYTFTITPPTRFLEYSSETKNPLLAPSPRPLQSPLLAPSLVYNPALTYQPGQVVGTTVNIYGAVEGPYYQATQAVPLATPPPNAAFWQVFSNDAGQEQDISSRYYWVYTYQHWVDLVNATLRLCYQDTYAAFQAAWVVSGALDPFPYATFDDFLADVNCPQIVFDQSTRRFRIYADSDGFGQRLTTFVPAGAGVPGAETAPVFRLFFNTNMYGLFTNFPNFYWNNPSAATGPFAPLPTPDGYSTEILFPNKFYTNVSDYRLPPQSGVPPLGYVPIAEQKVYWISEQDYPSDDSLWSPIESIVFTSTLLPVRAEQTGAPVILGKTNLGFSSATVQSAFQPIITDIALDQSNKGAACYREFLYYVPTAEYRLTDFGASKQDIRNIDIQVFWKNRLNNELYPISMYNLSSVSIKVMFRHKEAGAK